tara:strand:- start:414 stop:887 length:474 start_codon:yes stop_codon:yes gene_type:complete
MAKVGRAARVASRQRVEEIGNGTSAGLDKTIESAETGELYLIHHNHGSTLTVTLPAMQSGAYFKFVWKTLMNAGSSGFKLTTADGVDGELVGSIFEQVTGGGNANSAVQQDDGADHQVTIGGHVHEGSYLECYCDGSVWYVHGMLNVNAVGKATFGT